MAARLQLLACLGLAALTGACASTPFEIRTDLEWVAQLKIDAEPPAPLDLGFPEAFPDPDSRSSILVSGDLVIYELRIQEKGEETLRYLTIEVKQPYRVDGRRQYQSISFTFSNSSETIRLRTPVHAIALSLHDEHGALLKESSVRLAEGVAQDHTKACLIFTSLDEGLFESDTELQVSLPKHLENQISEVITYSMQSLIALLGLAQDDELLSSLLWEVIDKPSIASVLLNLGVKVDTRPGFHLAKSVPTPFTNIALEGPFWNLPIGIAINGDTALHVNLLVTEPKPPYSVTGGIIAFEGRHPTRPITVRAKLVGARLGSTTP